MPATAMLRRLPALRIAGVSGLCLLGTTQAKAHLGPPFPIIVDQPIPGYMVNVLANPDVGQAIAIVVIEPAKMAQARPVAEVDVWTQKAADPKKNPVLAERSKHDPTQYVASPFLDAVGPWKMGIDVHFVDGTVRTLVADVQATPPGVGPWGLLLFSAPILLFGALFGAVIVRRARRSRR